MFIMLVIIDLAASFGKRKKRRLQLGAGLAPGYKRRNHERDHSSSEGFRRPCLRRACCFLATRRRSRDAREGFVALRGRGTCRACSTISRSLARQS